MNWKSLQIRQKLYLGFGIMVLVTALFGGILLNGLYNINKSSKLLYNEQIPALSDTYELQNHWQKAVFNLRTFSTQKEEQYFVLANHHINRAINILDSLQTHNNEKANSSWQSLKKELDNFKKQAQKSYKAAIQIDNSYEQLDSAQTELQKLSDNYLGLQYQKLKRDVDKKAPDHIIKRRVDKISLMNEIVDITKDLKVKIGETHFRNKPELLNNLGPSFDIIRMNVETILPMTTKQYDIDALNEILKQNKICETSTGNLRNNWLSYSKMNNHDFLERGLSLTMNMAKHKEDYLARSAFSNLQHASNARNSWWWSISLSLIAGGILAWLISRSLSDPLLDLTKLAELQADGFLVSVPDTQRNDEIGILTRSMQAHQQQTHTIVNGLTSMGASFKSLMERLQQRSDSLTQTTNSQASSAEEISASIEEIHTLTEKSSSEASKAASELKTTQKDVDYYITQNRSAINHMQQLIDRASVISELASQTYILALNASIEAARDQGNGNNKGFAVIAKSMRELAEKVKVAAEELNHLSEHGQQSSDEAYKNMDRLNQIIKSNGAVLENLTNMAFQQNSEISQISGAIQQLNIETQNTSQTTEALAEEAARIGTHVDELQDMLSFYKKEEQNDNNLPEINQWEWAELFAAGEHEEENKTIGLEEIASSV